MKRKAIRTIQMFISRKTSRSLHIIASFHSQFRLILSLHQFSLCFGMLRQETVDGSIEDMTILLPNQSPEPTAVAAAVAIPAANRRWLSFLR
jgi:hypothetical protein